ncbi:MAG TPA: hypothetical protein VJZ91_01875 [Blastocatellia bacterium]|nr:hypothetical protein [Blastocatellia bacterium]
MSSPAKAPDSDGGTSGGDYMNDVWAHARFYARVEEWTISEA